MFFVGLKTFCMIWEHGFLMFFEEKRCGGKRGVCVCGEGGGGGGGGIKENLYEWICSMKQKS